MTDLDVYNKTLAYIYKTDRVTENDLATLFQDNDITFSPKIINSMKTFYNSSTLRLTELQAKDMSLVMGLDTIARYVEDTIFDANGKPDIDIIVSIFDKFQPNNTFTREQINNFFLDKSDKSSLESYLRNLLS